MERGTQLSSLQMFPAGKEGVLTGRSWGSFRYQKFWKRRRLFFFFFEKEAFDISFGSVMDKNLSLWQAHEMDNYSFHLSHGLR